MCDHDRFMSPADLPATLSDKMTLSQGIAGMSMRD